MKRCKKCGESKPPDAFYGASGTRDGLRSSCKACDSARKKLWYAANRDRVIEKVSAWQRDNRDRYNARLREYKREHPDKDRAGHLKRKFDLTLDDYDALLARQGGRCAICRRKPGKVSLHVDHDHETGEIRGLLCFRCNGGLGQFGERADRLVRAASYLEADDELTNLAKERARGLRVR